MPSEHVPKVNVQIHIVVVLKNTKCNKHIREVAGEGGTAYAVGIKPLRKDT